ncbi:MAG TPA: glycosyltransferase family 2 protein [Caulobacteraceae bacterium]
MPTFSCVTTCKSRLDQLRQSLPRMMSFADTEVVVVDYDCPQGTSDWVQGAYPAARVVSVRGEPSFNAARARNLGASATSAPWLLFLDVDTVAQIDLPEQLTPLLSPASFLLPDPRPAELYGALLVSRARYDQVDGYDEALQGWGSEDEDITERLTDVGLLVGSFPGALLQSLHHDNALRVLHHEIKDRLVNNSVNHLYRHAKRDLTRLGMKLDLPDRKVLYAAVRQATFEPGARGFEVAVRNFMNPAIGRTIEAFLRYQLTPIDG